jgi:hypothetical protein
MPSERNVVGMPPTVIGGMLTPCESMHATPKFNRRRPLASKTSLGQIGDRLEVGLAAAEYRNRIHL